MTFRRLGKRVAHRARPTAGQTRRYLPVLMFIAFGLAVTIGLFVFTRQWERRDNQAALDYASKHFVEAIRRAAEQIEMAHKYVRQDYYGSPHVSRDEFSLCAETILAYAPSLKVLQWAPHVARDDRPVFEQTVRREGWPDYRILEPDPRGQLIPAQQRGGYFPILYAATKSGFQAKLGWDFAADPVLRSAIDKCRDTNQFVVSDRIDLSKVGFSPRTIQTFLPVYRDFRNVHTVAERRTHIEGLLVGLCEVDALVNDALNYASGPQGIDVALFDESMPTDKSLLYFHPSRMRTSQNIGSVAEAEREPRGLHCAESLKFGGRRWLLVCTPAPQFFAFHADWRSWTVLVIGMLVTCLSAAYTWSATTRRERVERLVEKRTSELCRKDEQLRLSQELKAQAIRIAHEETIDRLVTASLYRDEETGMHIRRTGLFSELLARAAGWSKSDAEILRLAAPMHDVGKIGIPDAILRKPGKLTPAEFEIMKTHTLLGAKMLEGSQSDILRMARSIALCHHERWDGTGYPRGLSGLAIPEPARILSIVDVYDALSHDRVYRPAMPEKEILEILRKGAGTHFDPTLLDAFLANYRAVRRIGLQNPDQSPANDETTPLLSPIPTVTSMPVDAMPQWL